jgi:hypothetical protein
MKYSISLKHGRPCCVNENSFVVELIEIVPSGSIVTLFFAFLPLGRFKPRASLMHFTDPLSIEVASTLVFSSARTPGTVLH